MECPDPSSFEFNTEDISGRHHFQCAQGVPSAPGLGWVDFDLGVPPSCPATQTPVIFPPAQAEFCRQWNTQNSSQPSPRADGTPCIPGGKLALVALVRMYCIRVTGFIFTFRTKMRRPST